MASSPESQFKLLPIRRRFPVHQNPFFSSGTSALSAATIRNHLFELAQQMSVGAGVPPGFQGCHIIKINGYVFEGHITSDIIKRLLAEHPQDVIGLSLPSGVPGMEGPRDSSLVVYAIKKEGTTTTSAMQ
jgi:hypothetical protein